ncbi:MAG: hypothetical protein IKO07_10270 [Clostridia bacterium]|nr:hypothetical protein [Clostridia bacterium]
MKKSLSVILALCLALMMAVPALADGYTLQDPNVTAPGEIPVVKEKITLSIGITQDSNTLSYEYGENYMTTYLEDLTGIHLEWVLYPATGSDANSKLRLQVSGGEELPDILEGFDLDTDSVREAYGQAGALIPLNDYIGTLDYYHSQALAKVPEVIEGQDMWKLGRSLDGNYYGMLRLYRTLPNFYSARAWINRDFVAALGMEMPEEAPTQEWFVEFLRGVRDNDVNGNGDPNDEVPLVGGTGWQQNVLYWILKQYTYMNYADSFLQIEDGKLSNAYTKEGFKEGLKFARSLYEEGLIPDYAFTQDNASYVAMIAAETPFVGIGVSGSCSAFGANMPIMDPIPVVQGPDGYAVCGYFSQNPNFEQCITKDCEHPEAAFRMFDAENYEKDFILVQRWGEPGVDWVLAEEGSRGMYDEMGLPGYFTVLQSVWGVPQKSHWAGKFLGGVDYDNLNSRFTWDGNEANNEYKNALAVAKQVNYKPDEYIVKIIYSVEEQEDWANTRAAIATYVKQSMAEFATGVRDIDAEWDSFQEAIKGMGSEELLAMDQAAYERTMAD